MNDNADRADRHWAALCLLSRSRPWSERPRTRFTGRRTRADRVERDGGDGRVAVR